ncbi:hypothetical protein BC834DRAFT_1009126, partial [Gloeopeniophorella convolvens]
VFGSLDCFCCLSDLNLEGIPLSDDSILYIHRLPGLSRLNLNCTGISDVGIFYIVALRRTVVTLSLRDNPGITDDSGPALSMLLHLKILDLCGTNVTMAGMRRLGHFSSTLALDIPYECEAYLDTLHTQYLLSPLPPLITQPDAAPVLEFSALKRNLSAHAAYNPAVLTSGSKAVLCTRLTELLERRRGDLAVREMVWRRRDPGNGEVSGQASCG